LTRERALDPGMSCFYFMISLVLSLHFVFYYLLIITNLKWSHLSRSCSKDKRKKIARIYDVKSLVWLFYVKANLLDVWATFPELND
jgi:hypothetical protein